MKYFIRTFNPNVVGKTGTPLEKGKERDGSDWKKFEDILISVLKELNHKILIQPESPIIKDEPKDADKRIYVHKTIKEKSNGDFFYMQMHLKELFVFDNKGWGADHSKSINQEDLKTIDTDKAIKFVNELKNEFLTSGVSKHKQLYKTSFLDKFQKDVKDYILVPLQIPRDYVIKNHSPISVIDFVKIMSQWAIKNKKNIIFKLHPHNKRDKDIKREVLKATLLNKYVYQRDGNIQNMISKSRGVVVINSGVGFESLIHGKSVATFGSCDYKAATLDLSSSDLTQLDDFITNNPLKEDAIKLVYYYCHYHAYFIRDKESVKNKLLNVLKGIS